MLFSEEEIKPFKFFKSVAIKLNRFALTVEKNHNYYAEGLVKTEYGPINHTYFFPALKNLITEIDTIVRNKMVTGINEILYKDFNGIINDLDFNVNKNLDNNSIEGYKSKFSLEKFFVDLYIFLNDIFKDKSKYTSVITLANLTTDSQDFYKSLASLVVGKAFENDDYYSGILLKINKFEHKINELSNASNINSTEFKKEIENFFTSQRVSFEQRVNETINLFNADITKIQNNYKSDLVQQVSNLNTQVANSKNEVDNLDQAIESYKSTVSTKIQNEISKHYQKKARMEMITYWGATTFSIVLILSSLGLLAWGLVDYYHDYISTNICLKDEAFNACVSRLEKVRDITKNIGITFFVMRFSFSLLLFLTVIYTSRIAIRAYSHWRHSENMHLKLSSLEPFITELPKEVRHEIHRELIPDYFGKDAGLVDTANEKFKDLPANVSAVAMKAMEQISGNGNSSGTERNTNNQSTGTQ